jgi:cytochrome c oxidase assembly protein subunit 15
MKYNKNIRAWLIAGCVLIFFQIIIGGITRITGSGLSITKWEIVTGTLPPLSEEEWIKEFELYKGTPQYKKINDGMGMSQFKFIYFWEYFHRLWARLMGLIFIIPFFFFFKKKWLDKAILKHLGIVLLCASLAAVFGWIMVASGLIERPWVNAYKLSLHLGIALLTLATLLWLNFSVFTDKDNLIRSSALSRSARIFFVLLIVQMFFGAVVSGMRAALYFPSWPDMNGELFPSILLDSSVWTLKGIIDYDKDALMPALIHVLHRNWAYFVLAYSVYHIYKLYKANTGIRYIRTNIVLFVLLILQALLGILTLLYTDNTIPVFLGVMHQAIAIFIFSLALYNIFIFRKPIISIDE